MGRMDVSAADAKGIGVDLVDESPDFLLLSKPANKSSPGSEGASFLAVFMDRRSFSSFSFRTFCFSSSKFVISSFSWVAPNVTSNSP
ncbi:hypothetical protein M378DRAFT_161590 [Amanita muscaria Koide BX008]|uniref:Uncharacterized protein n=1 Tax=Amanita muscaria (strain Koide BX008) TaxID=946122 RepID=A0A0C2TGC2_AMAMK|nr:hypothetical protein M378DRAFT_161590 [Amanita muscaria Koide BX008]